MLLGQTHTAFVAPSLCLSDVPLTLTFLQNLVIESWCPDAFVLWCQPRCSPSCAPGSPLTYLSSENIYLVPLLTFLSNHLSWVNCADAGQGPAGLINKCPIGD